MKSSSRFCFHLDSLIWFLMRWILFQLFVLFIHIHLLAKLHIPLTTLTFVVTLKVRSVALGIVSRRVDWKQLTVLETLDSKNPSFFYLFFFLIWNSSYKWLLFVVFASFIRRIFKNIFRHAEQISQVNIIRLLLAIYIDNLCLKLKYELSVYV